ncbi:MAG: sugar phosphate isomerase/epimerase [Novosphingobium sp.]|nr:sugar phosphate isomerase/epimerase [Novosphingobium sp.]
MDHTDRIGIEFISVLGLPPVAFVALAAELGCRHIGIALAPFTANPHRYEAWSLRDSATLRRDFRQALVDHAVAPSVGEGFLAWPDKPVSDLAGDLDLMAELGVPLVNIVSLDPDLDRAGAELATFAELARARGMRATVEFLPGLPMADLPTAVEVVRRSGHSNLALLIDAMHVFRSGGTAADVAALDPSLIGYLQVCDVPLAQPAMSYGDEARNERRIPGEGELPLLDLLHAVPRDLVVGLETPMLSKAEAGLSPRDVLAPAVAATAALLRQLES